MGVVGALGALVWAGSNVLDAMQGGTRRFTGSRWLPSGAIPPPTTFYGEGTPEIDRDAWRLLVTGRVENPLSLDLDALAALGTEDRDGTLDCTSGWVMTTGWRGTPLSAVLEAAGADPRATRVVVRSVTGWSTALERHELDGCLLATHVAGERLPAANGAPCRLTVPTRRGLDWVKWVAEVEVA
jgi:DMSO/TMAO reductase YedYZ molybdopterin-dependent catalytic subunit